MQTSIKNRLIVGTTIGAIAAVLVVIQNANAGPITNPGAAPYIKLAVYQGIVSIVPGGPTDNLLEIGNGGRDIAGTGSIFIRPDSLNSASANYAEFYKDNLGKASLKVPGSFTSGPISKRYVGKLGFDDSAQAYRYEVARIGYDQINWSANSSVFVELHQKYWDAGGYKKYEVRAGYTDDGSIRLIEAIGPNSVGSIMTEGRVVAGPRVQVTSNLNIHYYPIYVETDYYSTWEVIVSHNMTEVANSPTGASQLKIYDAPAGTPIASFAAADVVTNEFTNTFEKNINVAGSICFGAPGFSDCHNTWTDLGGGPSATQHWTDDGAVADTANYATIGVTRGAPGVNNAYIGLTKAGTVSWGIGVGATALSDALIFGQTVSGKTIPTAYLSIGKNGTGVTVPTGNLLVSAGNVGVGQGAPAAKLTVNHSLANVGNANDAVGIYANTTSSAIYAQQDNAAGYAGYFSGSSYFKGRAGGTDTNGNPIYGTLSVYNNSAGPFGAAIYAFGGDVFNGQGVNGSIGVIGVGARTVANGQYTYGVYGTTGGNTGAAATAKSYGGYFSSSTGSWVGTNYGIYAEAGSPIGGTHYAGYFSNPSTFAGVDNYAAMFKGRVYQQGNQFTPTKSLPLVAIAYPVNPSTCQAECRAAGLECWGGISPQPGNLKVVTCTETVQSTACLCAQFAQ